MNLQGYVRCVLALLTGLWVTAGTATAIGFGVLKGLRSANGGALGPELLESSGVVAALLAVYAVSAAIGGWAAAWVTLASPRRLMIMLSISHVGSWLFVLALGASPFPVGFSLGLAAAAVLGTIAGVAARARQVRGRPGSAVLPEAAA
jgi:hypothetical protein